ncbi:FecR family protein [Arcticibacter tournemirensis]|uniref:FecR family protein n=1 Tax=Arcticibacter tournemirensis TaxID=699437 RepID=A0A4Q0MA78_9SPHI|nr:FecR domain-containing protein [Arcticibacter tournemirensis]RXF69709.1 FecR family protein [Arcticibacter tournemirensis]
MQKKDVNDLIAKFREGKCTEEEETLLKYWLHHLNQQGESGLTEGDFLEAKEQMWNEITPIRKLRRSYAGWYAAAAAILILAVSFGLYFFKNGPNTQTQQMSRSIEPGGNKAVLTLANGRQVVLNGTANGKIAEQSGLRISKTADGLLVCTAVSADRDTKNNNLQYNTIVTPKGGQYQINLPDGSKVWLNAASSLRFPSSFSGKERRVELTGEGYFEVNHALPVARRNPFIVSCSGQEVKVLGTHFNISSYSDEAAVRTTLLEGSVLVDAIAQASHVSDVVKLVPGQQSVLLNSSLKVEKVDVESVIAWKNGYFRFNDESLESIMRKVERWYDVKVEFEDASLKYEPLAGVITRFANVSDLLRMMELTGQVKFEVHENTIRVLKN